MFKKKKEAQKKEFIMRRLVANAKDSKNEFEYTYANSDEAMKDFIINSGFGYSQRGLDLYIPCYRFFTTSTYVRKEDVKKLIESLVVLDDNLYGVYKDLSDKGLVMDPVFNYLDEKDSNYYVAKEELEVVRNLVTKEVKPRYFPGSEGTYFFNVLNRDFASDTPNYWLFLYKEFGYLDKAKLRDYNGGDKNEY